MPQGSGADLSERRGAAYELSVTQCSMDEGSLARTVWDTPRSMASWEGPWAAGSKKADDLARMTDGQLIEAAAEWTQHGPYEMELQRRLVVALTEFKSSADRSSKWLLVCTVALVVLTVVITVLTLVLVVNPPA